MQLFSLVLDVAWCVLRCFLKASQLMGKSNMSEPTSSKAVLPRKKGLYHSIVESQSELIVRWLPDGTRTFVNDAYCKYRRSPREELVGSGFFQFLLEEDVAKIERKLATLTPENDTATDCHPSITPDGDLQWQEWTDRGLFDDEGRLVEVQSVGRPIGERQKLEARLRFREHQLRAMFQASAAGLTVRGLEEGELLDANLAMAKMFGYTREEFLELEPQDYVVEDALPLYSEMLEATRRGERFEFVTQGIHRDGRTLDLEGYFQPMSFDGCEQVLGVVYDVTERNELVRDLRMRESAWRTLFECAPDAILVHALDGAILDVNQAAGELFRCEPAELLGRNVADVVPPARRSLALDNFKKMKEGELRWLEGRCLRSDGTEVPVDIRSKRFEHNGKEALLVHLSDSTERRSLENQLRQAQKMEAVGRLAGGIAHDFNNLLTAILGYTELAQDQLEENHALEKDLSEIQEAAERAAGLTRQLLAFSRQQTLRPERVSLNDVVLGMQSLCTRTLGEHIRCELQLDSDLGAVRIDKVQVEQIVLNLAINARDAMPDGGELRFATRNVTLCESRPAGDVLVPPGSYVSLTCSDTGVGMTDEVRSRIFEPFFSTKPADKGTGLGLSTVYGIVRQSGGFIEVESESGRGTTFEILVPRLNGEAQEVRMTEPASSRSPSAPTVLLVDDNPAVLRFAKRTLETGGFSVLPAKSGEEAVKLACERGGLIDLLLTDLALPGLDGLELARELKSKFPALKILLMTGYGGTERFRKSGGQEISRLLQKPFVGRSLLSAVEAALL